MAAEKVEMTQKLYRPTAEARELAERLFKESGMEFERDFFAHVFATYELQQMKNGLGAGYQKILSQLEYNTKSIVEAFTSVLNTEQAERLQIAEGYDDKIAKLAAELAEQQDEIVRLKKVQAETAEQAAKVMDENTELRKYTANIEKLNIKNEEILSENKERIEKLSKMVADGQDAVIKKQELEARISEISKISEKYKEDIAAAEKSMAALRMTYDEQIRQLQVRHEEELQREAERAEIAKEKALTVAERQHTADIRRMLDEMGELRKEIHAQQLLIAEQRQKLAEKTNTVPKRNPRTEN